MTMNIMKMITVTRNYDNHNKNDNDDNNNYITGKGFIHIESHFH